MKRTLAIFALAGMMAISACASARSRVPVVRIYDTDELTYNRLTHRRGDIVIERTIGKVLDEQGNGRILNTNDSRYNYISYKGLEDAVPGDVVITYCIYNPETEYEDDIIERFDYIVER